MIRYIIFDFDGTIADTFNIIRDIVKKEIGGTSEEAFMLLKQEGIKGVMKKKKIPFWKLPKLTYKVLKLLRNRKNIKLFPEIPNVCKKLSKNYKLGIVSSNSEENIKEILKRNNAQNLFGFIYSDISIFGKHLTLKKMCHKFNLNPNETIYIGDEDRDIVAAKKVKVKAIAVTWGYNSEKRLYKENPDYLVKSPKQLIKVISNLSK